jgi:hypothetical protein
MHLELGRFRRRLLLPALAAIWLAPISAEGQVPSDVVVNGGGSAVLTAPPPEGGADRKYPVHFTMIAGFDEETPRGHISFTFGQAFARDWGAVPPNDAMSVAGAISAITEDADGFVHLTGTLTEVDFTKGDGVVFLIDDTFDVKLGGTLPADELVLQWCLLPAFSIRVTNGVLTVIPPAAVARGEDGIGIAPHLSVVADTGVPCARGRNETAGARP